MRQINSFEKGSSVTAHCIINIQHGCERKASRLYLEIFAYNSLTEMGKRRSFLFVISKVITLKAPSVCTPALTNKQHQNYYFDIPICGVVACELPHHCFANSHIAGHYCSRVIFNILKQQEKLRLKKPRKLTYDITSGRAHNPAG